MNHPYQPLTLRKQFRIGNCNFALQACRWKQMNLRQKSQTAQFPVSSSKGGVVPNMRLHQSSVILSQHLYMFGGGISKGVQKQGQTFCCINLKNDRWHEISHKSTPRNRDSHGLALLKQEVYLFGGSNGQKYFNDLSSFNNFTNEWKTLQGGNNTDANEKPNQTITPSPRDVMIFLSVKNQFLLLVGGVNLLTDERYPQDAFVWKSNQWRQLKHQNYPKGLVLAKAIQASGRVYAFGGYSISNGQYNQTLYQLAIDESLSKMQWKEVALSIEIRPQGRVNHDMMRINSQYFMLIGGQKVNTKIHKDIWMFDLFASRWTRIQPKNGPLRGIHSFSGVMHNNIVYLIGGFLQDRKQINDQILTIEFASQQIFKSQVCENCVNLMQKKQQQSRKFPKDLSISVGFLYNVALQIKFPFHAISMLYQASKYFKSTQFHISSQKTQNNFSYLRIEFDGCTFAREQFISFITHTNSSTQLKNATQSIKLAALRLGKTFLFVSSDRRFRYVYLLSADSRVSPHFDQTYVYYAYVENIQLQRIQTEEGTKQRKLILNILKTHISKPEIILSTPEKSIILIFQNKIVMSSEKDYICELYSQEDDLKVWKNIKKVQFLQERGYIIGQEVQISLKKWMQLYYCQKAVANETKFFFNGSQQPVKFTRYRDILEKLQQEEIIHKVQLPSQSGVQLNGCIYITLHQNLLLNNYGLLIYSRGRLYSRYYIEFGRLFPMYFYKSKYKQAKTIFYELGYVNVVKGLDQDYFKNGFVRQEKYALLLQKIQQKCDKKREQLMTAMIRNGLDNVEEQNKAGGKKLKLG